jgi:hypothetical protein
MTSIRVSGWQPLLLLRLLLLPLLLLLLLRLVLVCCLNSTLLLTPQPAGSCWVCALYVLPPALIAPC